MRSSGRNSTICGKNAIAKIGTTTAAIRGRASRTYSSIGVPSVLAGHGAVRSH